MAADPIADRLALVGRQDLVSEVSLAAWGFLVLAALTALPAFANVHDETPSMGLHSPRGSSFQPHP